MCKSYGGQLAELESATKQKEIFIKLLNDFEIRGYDFWVGGLNPGLFWMWINSGKPVNPKVDLKAMMPNRKSRIIVEFDYAPNNSSSSTTSVPATTLPTSTEPAEEARKRVDKSTPATPKIVNKPTKPSKPAQQTSKPVGGSGGFEIKGSGRCLRLSYNPSTHDYEYTGVDCGLRSNYLCEFIDHTSENEISRVAKSLGL